MISTFQRILIQISVVVLILAALTGFINNFNQRSATQAAIPTTPATESTVPLPIQDLPELQIKQNTDGIQRRMQLYTEIPERPNLGISQYTVQKGDTAWSIGEKFDLKPETILWGNDGLSAEAGNLTISTTLNILPVDGALHIVNEGDTLDGIAAMHGVSVEAIANFIGNDFPLADPIELEQGQQIIVPGGRGAIVWQEPGPPVVAGLGRKSPGLYSGALVNIGTGYFIWPIAPPIVITQNYWGGHPALDMDTYYRQPVFAADSGTVIFSGWSTTGYGNLVIVDHGNGYWTYYAHNEANLVGVGQGVIQGQQIAESGSTGNSTGYHLDFRIRVDGGSFLNPKDYLP